MKQESKDEMKKNMATGASTAAGAAVGVVAGAAITPQSAEASDEIVPEVVAQPAAPQPAPAPTSQDVKPEPVQPVNPEPKPVDPVQPDPEPEVEVLSYDRVTNPDGSQMDIAVVNVEGQEVGFLDIDLDGKADLMMVDMNGDQQIQENEVTQVQDQNIAMQPFANAVGFNPQFAQNDLPDYVNDADVDTYNA